MVSGQVSQTAMSHGAPQSHPVRVLVVDDDAAFRASVVAMLALDDSVVVVGQANDGEEAVTRAAELAPDVIVMDVSMPRQDGIEATRKVRALRRTVAIIVLTGSDRTGQESDALQAGAVAYLRKDVDALCDLLPLLRAVGVAPAA
jgi:DNA-binding NarL/FixJ family response regulator